MSRASHPRETLSTHDRSSCAYEERAAAAWEEVAGLLVIAYRRLKAIRQVSPRQEQNRGENALANTPTQSVHGVVP